MKSAGIIFKLKQLGFALVKLYTVFQATRWSHETV